MDTGEQKGTAQSIDEIADGIIATMKQYMEGYHYPYDRWFVGVSENPREHLLERHRMNPNIGPCIHLAAPNADVAKIVGMYFKDIMGTDGNMDCGTSEARFVYAYKKSMHTKP